MKLKIHHEPHFISVKKQVSTKIRSLFSFYKVIDIDVVIEVESAIKPRVFLDAISGIKNRISSETGEEFYAIQIEKDS